MPDGQDQNGVLLIAVQGEVAGLAARNDEFPQAMLGRAPDLGVIFEDLHRLGDEIDGFERCCGCGLEEKVREPLEVGERPTGVDQPRQALALGLGAGLPCARDLR